MSKFREGDRVRFTPGYLRSAQPGGMTEEENYPMIVQHCREQQRGTRMVEEYALALAVSGVALIGRFPASGLKLDRSAAAAPEAEKTALMTNAEIMAAAVRESQQQQAITAITAALYSLTGEDGTQRAAQLFRDDQRVSYAALCVANGSLSLDRLAGVVRTAITPAAPAPEVPKPEPGDAEADMRQRWVLSADAMLTATRIFEALPKAEHVIFPQLLPGKIRGVWEIGQEVRTVAATLICGPEFMDYAVARSAAVDIARARLAERYAGVGVAGWGVVHRDGTFAVFED